LEDYLEQFGTVPIPPYLQRTAEHSDKTAYNNVYAADGGSVAAPTAGLHFTNKLLEELGKENCSYLTLHVGAGTFQPVVAKDARNHNMHAESFSVSVSEIRRIIAVLDEGKPLMCVGTTSCRTLESLFWCGIKRLRGFDVDTQNLALGQFEWVPLMVGQGKHTSRQNALRALVDGFDEDTDATISGKTSLMIVPGSYDFRMIDHLVTNFHAPDSTLMLLVSAFLNKVKVKTLYEDAQNNGFRFLSYGDACMLSRSDQRNESGRV
jgi:S-adenosylmethionine:tRNA ribosyltransferase-isomerase